MENKLQVTSNQSVALIEPKVLLQTPLPSSVMAIVDNPDAMALSGFNKQDKHYGYKFLVLALIEVNEQLNISGKMTDSQITFSARMLDKKYFFFTPDDFRLAFMNGLTGKYGKLFNRLDIEVLCGWLEEYNMERTQYAIDRHSKFKENYSPRIGKVDNESAYKEVFAKNFSDAVKKGKQ